MDYRKNYYDYIAYVKTLNRKKEDGEYYEEHHILPYSLGGDNSKENLVLLTAREHYLAHYLLVKITTGQDRKKMIWAFHRMQYSDASRKGKRITNSRLYELVRKNYIKDIFDDEWHQKHSEAIKGRFWINNGKENKFIKNPEEYLSQGWKKGRLKFIHKKQRRKEERKRKQRETRYWMYKEGEQKDIMVTLKEIPVFESNGWKRGRLKIAISSKPGENSKGRIRITKGNLEKSILPEELENYLNDGWVKGRRVVSEETKEKMHQSRLNPNSNFQKRFEKIRNGEIEMYHPKNVTLFKDGQYLTLDTNKNNIEPYLSDGWVKKGKPKSEEFKAKMRIKMIGNKNGSKKDHKGGMSDD
jgi:hypothetical protein